MDLKIPRPRFMRLRLIGTAVITLACVLLFSQFVFSAEFSAEVVMRGATVEMSGKVYVKDMLQRFEWDTEFGTVVTIIDASQEAAWTLLPDNKYIEASADESPIYIKDDEYEEVDLGTETVRGYECDVIRYIYADPEMGISTFWVARDLDYPLRVEEADATGQVKVIIEVLNIEEEQLCPCLFEIPEGYERL
jgi:S-adenosylmethionine:diacylglycerol 3-amino-3-carboxypropyl transferase